MNIELLRDADREDSWLLLVDGGEQSYVDLVDPAHLEFEYVQFFAAAVETRFPAGKPLRALHFGAGLCTVPRWIADRHPRSRQVVIEKSDEIAKLCRSLPLPSGIRLESEAMEEWLVATASAAAAEAADAVPKPAEATPDRAAPTTFDLAVVDVYSGPDTVVSAYCLEALATIHTALAPDGLFIANLSDAKPFELARAAVAGCLATWRHVAVVIEPPVLRGRRSGNVVLVASDPAVDGAALRRRCAAGMVRGTVLAGEELHAWVGTAVPAVTAAQLPVSGELNVRRLR